MLCAKCCVQKSASHLTELLKDCMFSTSFGISLLRFSTFLWFWKFLKKRRWRESLKFLKRGSYWIAFKVKWKNPDSRSPIQFDLKIRGKMWAGFILLAITLGSYFLNCFKVINMIHRVEQQSNHTGPPFFVFLYTLSFDVLFDKSHH